MRHRNGMAHERFDSTKTFAKCKVFKCICKLSSTGKTTSFEGDHTAEGFHLSKRKCVLRVRRKAGIVHFVCADIGDKALCDDLCILAVRAHADRERLYAAE